MRPKSPTLTAHELEMMKIVWQHDAPVTVRDVYEALRTRRTIAYTTVMTTLRLLHSKKKVLKRVKRGRAHVYQPTVTRDEVIQRLRPLLDLPVELLLPAHGEPTDRAALERVLS